MRRLTLVLALVCLPALLSAQEPAAAKPAEITEAQKLKADVLKLQVENAQLRKHIADLELQLLGSAARALEADFLKTVGAPEGSTWDWQQMRVKTPPAPTPPPQ